MHYRIDIDIMINMSSGKASKREKEVPCYKILTYEVV